MLSRLGPRPAALLAPVLGLLLAIAMLPLLAAPAHAATITVTGTVTGKNASGTTVPIEGVYVEAEDTDGNTLDPRAYDTTQADGTYQIELPATGTYRIVMECLDGAACADEYAPALPITQAFTGATTLNATMDRWGTISGTVKRNSTATAWPNATISASNDARDHWWSQDVTVDANGHFTIDKVAPGTVEVSGRESGAGEKFLATVPDQAFQVTAGQTATIDLLVEDWQGFYMRAVDPDGAPLETVRWNVFSRTAGGSWDNGLQYGPLQTGADGRMSYQITDGREYTMCFYDDVYADNFDPGPMRPNRYGTQCVGNRPDLASATAWQPTASVPKLKQDLTLPLLGKGMTPGDPQPTGDGVVAVGTPITVDPGNWEPLAVNLAWQWKYWDGSKFVAIPGATSPTYTPTSDMVGKSPTAFITGTAVGYAPATVTWSNGKVGDSAPTMTGSLSITGNLTVGSTVTAHAGTFTPADTDLSWWWYLDGHPISGAQGETIDITSDMAGGRLEARLLAYDWDSSDSTYFDRVSVDVPGALKGTTPEITGTTTVGATLKALTGTWTAGTTLSYQWLRAGSPISGATSPTYALVAADQGKAISVKVTGKLSGYADVVKTSVATASVAAATFTSTPAPTISGEATVGKTLTANVPAWTPAATTTSYQWLRDGSPISGATSKTYPLVAADQGKTITVRVSGARDGYTSVTKTSTATAAVAAGEFATQKPTISGTAMVGETVTATVAAWTPAATTTTYQWLRDGVEIPGATESTYEIGTADVDIQLTVQVTGARDGYVTATETSSAVTVDGADFTTAPVPTITGKAKVGKTLTADAGEWTPTPATTTYQWFRSGAPIDGATEATYVLTAADLKATITVEVTAAADGYNSETAASEPTAAVVKGQFSKAPKPTIDGKLKVGKKLKAVTGKWQPVPTKTTYKWYRSGKRIKGATGKTYKVTKADKGKKIRVVVKQKAPGYVTTTKKSASTKRVR